MKKNRKVKPHIQRLHFMIFSIICLCFAVFFIASQFKENIMFFVTPSQISEREIKEGDIFRLGGLVTEGSFKKLAANEYEFVIEDAARQQKIIYIGLLPNLFREGQGVIATGKLENGVFRANEILAKHDENYMPKEVYDELKKFEEAEKQKYNKDK